MVDERSRAAQFFNYYKPVVEQEITLISEIEQLQSIVEETAKQCANPTTLPEMSEDSINAYKVPDYLVPGGTRELQAGAVSRYVIMKNIRIKIQKILTINVNILF